MGRVNDLRTPIQGICDPHKAENQQPIIFSNRVFSGLVFDQGSPLQYHYMNGLMAPLSHLAGIANKLNLHSIRRGCLKVLREIIDMKITKHLMGHKSGLKAFSAYVSNVSSLDV